MPSADQPPLQGEWRTSWEREYTILFYIAKRILGNDADAEDAVQDAFTSLLEHGDKRANRAFLVGVVKHKALDILRKQKRILNLQEEVYEELAHDPVENLSPEEERQLESLPDEVRQLAEKLSPRLQKLFLFFLRHLDSDPEDHWPLWAKENGLDPKNRVQRNTHFDVPKRLLRDKLIALDIHKLLKGKE